MITKYVPVAIHDMVFNIVTIDYGCLPDVRTSLLEILNISLTESMACLCLKSSVSSIENSQILLILVAVEVSALQPLNCFVCCLWL